MEMKDSGEPPSPRSREEIRTYANDEETVRNLPTSLRRALDAEDVQLRMFSEAAQSAHAPSTVERDTAEGHRAQDAAGDSRAGGRQIRRDYQAGDGSVQR